MQDGGGNENLLPHPFRVRRERLVAIVVDVEQLEEAVDLVIERRVGETAQSADEAEVLGSGEIRIEVGLLGNVASHRFIGVEVCQHVASIEAHLAAGRLQESREDLDRRALARSVRTEQAEHFTRPDVE